MELTVQKKHIKEETTPTVKKYFPVLHMSCASCAASAQSTLQNIAGVSEASVNYANGNAAIKFDPHAVRPEAMKKSLQAIGYDLLISETEDSGDKLEEMQRKEYTTLRRRTIWAIILSVPLIIIGMFDLDIPYGEYIMWALATPIVFFFGRQFFEGAWKQLKYRKANMDTLVALSTGIAYLFSVFNLLFASFWTSRGITPHVYFEAAGVIIAFIMIGKLLEERAKGHTSAAIKKLMGLQPAKVTRVNGNDMEEVPVSQVGVGNILLVKPGDKIAVDGSVVSGGSYVDESMMSGEPWPVNKKKDDPVFAGTINQKGSFQFRAEKVGGDTLLSQIIEMVKSAQGSRAPVQKLVDKIAGIFVPVVMGISLLSLLAWMIFGGATGTIYGLLAMVTVLIIACPCALGLATPTAIMAGMGKGAENGILIKDASTLELARKVNAVVLDKTGTITEGRPEVNEIIWLQDKKYEGELKSLEKQSEHPLAGAIVNHIGAYYLPLENFENFSGKGIRGEINGKTYFVGNRSWLDKNQISVPVNLQNRLSQWNEKAHTIVFFAEENTLLAAIAISDKIKESSAEAVRTLQQENIEVYMLTGDQENTAEAVAKQVGIRHYQAQMLPEDKIEFVKKLQSDGKVVAMAGDGINDSAALAQADVSIAMGKGSAIAMDIARMTILSSDLSRIPKAIKLSKQTTKTIRENLVWAFIYNIIGIPIAAGILYPINGFLLNPMIAGAAMALSSVSVVTNSLRLKTKKI